MENPTISLGNVEQLDLDSSICLEEKKFALNSNFQDRRMNEFYGGRIALKTGLRYLKYPGNIDKFPILPNKYGAPIMPDGTLGSVSHKGSLIVGAVAMGFPGCIGVDIELLQEIQNKLLIKRDLSSRILTESEIASLGQVPG